MKWELTVFLQHIRRCCFTNKTGREGGLSCIAFYWGNLECLCLSFVHSFLLGQSGVGANPELGKSPWVYVTIDGTLQSCKLYVYNVRSM